MDRKKGFKYISNKRKTKDNVGLLPNRGGNLVREDTEKMEYVSTIFASVSLTNPQESLTQETRVKEYWKEEFLLV